MRRADDLISTRSQQFVESVIGLQPQVAVVDCDGTLWAGDSGADFFYWEIEQGILPEKVVQWAVPRYDDYRAGKVDEETMCGEMVAIHAGIPVAQMEEAAARFFSMVVERRIFPEMQQLTEQLAQAGCDLWAVSSTNEWVVKNGASRFGIQPDHVLAVSLETDNGIATDRIIRVPSGPGKAVAINEVVRCSVDACFGNSIHDAAMLEISRNAFAVNPNRDLEQIALRKGWRVFWPEGTK